MVHGAVLIISALVSVLCLPLPSLHPSVISMRLFYYLYKLFLSLHIPQAIDALSEYPSTAAQNVLQDAVVNPSFYYQVRIAAARTLSKVGISLKFVL